MSILTQKKCTKCGETKFGLEFPRDKRKKDGVSSWCRKCHNVAALAWLNNHREDKHKYDKEYHAENRDRRLQKKAEYRAANPEKTKEWDKLNPEKNREKAKRYRQAHPEKGREWNYIRRARLEGNGGKITMQEWEFLKKFYNYTCLRCMQQEPEIKLTLDHVIPLSKGGPNVIDNAQPLCFSCNCKKNNKTIDYRVGKS